MEKIKISSVNVTCQNSDSMKNEYHKLARKLTTMFWNIELKFLPHGRYRYTHYTQWVDKIAIFIYLYPTIKSNQICNGKANVNAPANEQMYLIKIYKTTRKKGNENRRVKNTQSLPLKHSNI